MEEAGKCNEVSDLIRCSLLVIWSSSISNFNREGSCVRDT